MRTLFHGIIELTRREPLPLRTALVFLTLVFCPGYLSCVCVLHLPCQRLGRDCRIAIGSYACLCVASLRRLKPFDFTFPETLGSSNYEYDDVLMNNETFEVRDPP